MALTRRLMKENIRHRLEADLNAVLNQTLDAIGQNGVYLSPLQLAAILRATNELQSVLTDLFDRQDRETARP